MSLSSVLATMSSSATAARSKVREAKLRQRDLDKDIAKTNADLQKIATARKQSYEVRASIESASAVTPSVAIEYSTNDAQWRWVYEARLDTNAKHVTIARKASVEQRSGENWQNATLTLTTAQPASDAMTPQVASLFLDLRDEREREFLARPVWWPRIPALIAPSLSSRTILCGMHRQRVRIEVIHPLRHSSGWLD